MQLVGAILALVSATSAFPFFPLLHDRHVIGGSNAKKDRLYQVSLVKNGEHFCGGAAISDHHIVTAAHCVYSLNPTTISIRAGSLNRKAGTVHQIDPKSMKVMKCYNDRTHDCDIAVFKTKDKISKDVIRLKIANKNNEPADETLLTVTGWGLTGSGSSSLPDNLQVANVIKVQRSRCLSAYDGINTINERMICAGDVRKNICRGDSGGPLIDDRQKKLVGIVAWGAQDKPGTNCDPTKPGVFTSVANADVHDFITRST